MLPEAIEMLTDHVGQEWMDVAKLLGISQKSLIQIQLQEESNKCRMSKCIDLLPKLQWPDMKSILKTLKKDDIIELITRKTLITNGKGFFLIQ